MIRFLIVLNTALKKNKKRLLIMNYYVLFCQTVRTEKVCQILNKKDGLHAFIPKMEVYIHINGNIDLKTNIYLLKPK